MLPIWIFISFCLLQMLYFSGLILIFFGQHFMEHGKWFAACLLDYRYGAFNVLFSLFLSTLWSDIEWAISCESGMYTLCMVTGKWPYVIFKWEKWNDNIATSMTLLVTRQQHHQQQQQNLLHKWLARQWIALLCALTFSSEQQLSMI